MSVWFAGASVAVSVSILSYRFNQKKKVLHSVSSHSFFKSNNMSENVSIVCKTPMVP